MLFQPKTSRPMTAAERQRKCRENGKGKHRGPRKTREQLRAWRNQMGAEAQAREAARIAAAAYDVRWAISAMAA